MRFYFDEQCDITGSETLQRIKRPETASQVSGQWVKYVSLCQKVVSGEDTRHGVKKIPLINLFALVLFCSTVGNICKVNAQVIFENVHGIRQDNVTFFNSEGYEIFSQIVSGTLDEKGLKKIKKKFSIPKDTLPLVNPGISDYQILKHKKINGKSTEKLIYYLKNQTDGKVLVVGFITKCDRIPEFEKDFFEALITQKVPEFVFTPMIVDSINFAGRFIKLGPVCNWMKINSIQCRFRGQINWSEFSNQQRAKQMLISQKETTSDYSMTDIIEEKEVPVVFEGQQTIATRLKVKIKVPKFVTGGSNILFAYYVVAEVRGRYVSCVLSHYSDEAKEGELPILLREVMQLK